MKPLFVLIFTFLLALFFLKKKKSIYDYTQAGQIAMSVMLIFTGMAHFVFTEGMAMMLPSFLPCKIFLVYITGGLEIVFAVVLFVPQLKITTDWGLIVFLSAILPANIYAAMKQINYQEATLDGHGLSYLWFRIPLQVFFILWVYFFMIKKTPKKDNRNKKQLLKF